VGDVSRAVAVIALACAALCGLALAVQANSRVAGYGGTDIFVVNVSGTGHRNLTAGSEQARRVLRSLSPDGRMLAFDQLRVEGNYAFWSIELVPARGGPERTLFSFPGASAYDPAWSRDGKLLAFETCCGSAGVRIVRSDGTDVSRIPDGANPAWLAGPRLAFLGGGDVQDEVATVKPDGSDRNSVVNMWELGAEGLSELVASPNGRRLAFSAAAYAGWRKVFTTVRDGLLGETSSDAWAPSWSPTSRRLVFASSRGLMTARPDGSERRRFRTTEDLSPAVPSWSPDGTRIAFVASSSGSLIVLNVRHRALRVVAGYVDSQRPLWSRNGQRLYYAAPSSG
jgi:Tol biopolymer transport system component